MRGEKGFTLIELLVVMAIVGILSVIGIYQFAAYKMHTFCSSVETDVKNTVTAEEAYFSAYKAYSGGGIEIKTTHGTATNNIASTMNNVSTGTVIGNSTNCVRPDGAKTFTFDQASGQYTWS
jgi:type IV pilus assembly protein PilA